MADAAAELFAQEHEHFHLLFGRLADALQAVQRVWQLFDGIGQFMLHVFLSLEVLVDTSHQREHFGVARLQPGDLAVTPGARAPAAEPRGASGSGRRLALRLVRTGRDINVLFLRFGRFVPFKTGEQI